MDKVQKKKIISVRDISSSETCRVDGKAISVYK